MGRKTIKISEELHKYLTGKTVNKESFDATIKRIIKFKQGRK